jgi:hypothetical protein
MTAIAVKMASLGYILRSGGAKGADTAFESGAGMFKQIFYAKQCTPAAMEIAKRFHPAWNRCTEFTRKLHGRNTFQVLGSYLDEPSEGLICWTRDGCVSHKTRNINTGGTGTAISIAEAYGVKITNLAIPERYTEWQSWVRS